MTEKEFLIVFAIGALTGVLFRRFTNARKARKIKQGNQQQY
jgi:hypothetical protein